MGSRLYDANVSRIIFISLSTLTLLLRLYGFYKRQGMLSLIINYK